MRRTIPLIGVSMFMFFVSCSGDTESTNHQEDEVSVEINTGDIVINEFCFKADLENEFGKKSDWIELYNTTENDLILNAGEWTISDKPDVNDKYYIPETTVEAGGHLLLWCDGKDTVGKDIHTNFKIKAKGETLSLYYNGLLMDQQSFDSTSGDFGCKCRAQDGGEVWEYHDAPTPGKPNLFDNN